LDKRNLKWITWGVVVLTVLIVVVSINGNPTPPQTDPIIGNDTTAAPPISTDPPEQQTASPETGGQTDPGQSDYMEETTVIHIAAAGDLNVTDEVVAQGMGTAGYDFSDAFLDVAPVLSDADLTLLNFEGTLAGEPYGTKRGSAPLALAKQLGADFAFRADDPDLKEKVKEATRGRMCNMVIEVTGAAVALQEALEIVAPFGRVSLLGCTRISDCNIDFYQKVHRPGVSLIGAHNWARPLHESAPYYWTREDDYRTLLDFMATGRLKVAPMRSEIVSPERAPEIYGRLIANPVAPLGIVFDWSLVK